jgi:hypothetical protein
MPTFLYIFGFESPRQSRNNTDLGWDDEDSQGVLIDACDEAAALAWGREISERFIKLLFPRRIGFLARASIRELD